jgi:dihydrofolate reductase
MAKLLVVNHLTLDGVMQAPARPEEDTRGEFEHGGWASARYDELMTKETGEHMGADRVFLFGRRTYEDLYEVWSKRTGDPMGEALTNTPKYVASRTHTEPLPWSNSILLDGDATDAVPKLKQQPIGTLTIFGSGELIKSLMEADLIDEYLLMIHPLVLGTGRRMFPAGVHASLRLTDSVTTSTGVVIATYEPARN